MDNQLLLTYNTPLLLEYKKPKRRVFAEIVNTLYQIVAVVCVLFSGIFVLDIVNNEVTDNIMVGVYATIDFFAPDITLFEDTTKLGFVSKILGQDFRYISKNESIKHLIVYEELTQQDNKIIYKSTASGRISVPANAIVKSIDFNNKKSYLTLQLDKTLIMVIESKAVFGVHAGQYIKQGELLGSYMANDEMIVSFYKNGKILENPIDTDSGLNWIS